MEVVLNMAHQTVALFPDAGFLQHFAVAEVAAAAVPHEAALMAGLVAVEAVAVLPGRELGVDRPVAGFAVAGVVVRAESVRLVAGMAELVP